MSASAHRLLAYPDGLSLDSLGGKGVGDFLERPRRVAVFARTSVDEQYFHLQFLLLGFYLTQKRREAENAANTSFPLSHSAAV